MEECKRKIGTAVVYANDMYDAVLNADALLVVTEWKEFRVPNWRILKKSMKRALVLDGRNIYNRDELIKEGFTYECIGGHS